MGKPAWTLCIGMLVARLCLPGAHAQTPLITFDPLTPTTITVPANGTAVVQYVVTNTTQAQRTYEMRPIPGVNQVATPSPGRCARPIALPPRGECVLVLQIVGNQLPPAGVSGGPVLCRMGNPNECFQPAIVDALQITLGPPTQTAIEVTPSVLSFPAGTVATLTVANVGAADIGAGDIDVTVPQGVDITVDPGTCSDALPAGEVCELLLAASEPQPASTLQVHASNAPAVDVQVTVTDVLFADGFETPADDPTMSPAAPDAD